MTARHDWYWWVPRVAITEPTEASPMKHEMNVAIIKLEVPGLFVHHLLIWAYKDLIH
jgi:hypothetical protein